MSMCRIVLRDGQVMHIEADSLQVDKSGALKLLEKNNEGGFGINAIFAHGVWAYYLWTSLAGEG